MSSDFIIRAVAAAAAVALLVAPYAVAWARRLAAKAKGHLAATEKAGGVSVSDLHVVLDLAARLQAIGKTQAVVLCQQLLDEMLKPKVTQ